MLVANTELEKLEAAMRYSVFKQILNGLVDVVPPNCWISNQLATIKRTQQEISP